MNPKLLGEFYLAEKYQIDAVKDAIVEDVKLREIKIEDVLDILKVAESKCQLVQFADSLYELCLKVIKKSSDNIYKVFGMFDPEVEDESTSRLLHKLVFKAQLDKSKLCSNCQHFPCLNGLAVNLENFVKNATVTWKSGDLDICIIRKTMRVKAGAIVYKFKFEGEKYKVSEYDPAIDNDELSYHCI